MESDESQYHAIPQTMGRIAHETVDEKKTTNGRGDLVSISVCSNEFRIFGKIDLYRYSSKTLIERKYQLVMIYRMILFDPVFRECWLRMVLFGCNIQYMK